MLKDTYDLGPINENYNIVNETHGVIDTGVLTPEQLGMQTISISHGYEIAPGWWGWYGGTAYVATVLEETADKAIANPIENKYTFEYDASTFEFFNKHYPKLIVKIKQAIALGAWEVVGGTYSEQLPYQIGLESNIRQWVIGTRTIYEILGQWVKTYHYQEFMLFPKLPMILANVGIEQTVCENHLGICGRVHKGFRGVKWWFSSDGSKVLTISDYSDLFVDWPDVLHIVQTQHLLGEYFQKLAPKVNGSFTLTESDFYFDAAGYTDSYGNLASINNCLTEIKVLTAERFATIASILGGEDYSEQLTAAWKALLSTQNHDVMYCGSESYGSEIGASDFEGGRYVRTVSSKLAENVLQRSILSIAGQVNTVFEKPGCALIIFNPLAFGVTKIIETSFSFNKGEAKGIKIWHKSGEVPYYAVHSEQYDDGSLKNLQIVFMALDLPSMGYRTYHLEYLLEEYSPILNSGLSINQDEGVIQNQFIKVKMDKNGLITVIYSKLQNAILLGADESTEPATAYDKTSAIRFRNSLGREDWYAPKGWEVVEINPLKVVIRSCFETNLALNYIYLSLYDNIERLDVRVELVSKDDSGDILKVSLGEKKEKMWLDFIPAFKGHVKCDTVADVLNESRNYYFSNSWLNFDGSDKSFTIIHKGIHAWDEGYCYQESRDKSERAISAHIGQTENSWIPGMLRLNTEFGIDGVISQEFAILTMNNSDEYRIHKATQNFYFDSPVTVTSFHNGKLNSELEIIAIKSKNALVSAFYSDISTGKKPALRVWNPSLQEVNVEVVLGINASKVKNIRFDGTEIGEEYDITRNITIPPQGLQTIKFLNIDEPKTNSLETGVIFSTIPFTKEDNDYYFDAPLESYRLFWHYAEFRDEGNRVYMFTDPYEDIDLNLVESTKEGDYRVWNGNIMIPQANTGREIRLVLTWQNNKRYGVGTCLLTNDYSQRADEPVSIKVNGQLVVSYDFNLTKYIKYGENNDIRVKVLAPIIPQEELKKRSSIIQYSILENAGVFGNLKSSKLRIGYKITKKNYQNLCNSSIENPGFESEDLSGWVIKGNVINTNDGAGTSFFAKIAKTGIIEQEINIKPGNYVLMVKVKSKEAEGFIEIGNSSEKFAFVKLPDSNGTWENLSVPFITPINIFRVIIRGGTVKGENGFVCFDDFRIVANKVAKTVI
jgi:hypothetical protein